MSAHSPDSRYERDGNASVGRLALRSWSGVHHDEVMALIGTAGSVIVLQTQTSWRFSVIQTPGVFTNEVLPTSEHPTFEDFERMLIVDLSARCGTVSMLDWVALGDGMWRADFASHPAPAVIDLRYAALLAG